uniref:Pheromone receptor Rcb2 B44 n=1 Tax=Mycena chlorophos TaxID=658473 RepID=A0ABQ0L1W3_MYCCL|nr:pheromone receptor Rcb2 B44 [Mycena chlorophos]
MSAGLPLGAFVGALLVLVPLPWHWRARNVPTLSIIAWLFISNIVLAVNSIVWAGSIEIRAEVWCDIATKIHIGATMTLPSCCLCLCMHLERIASVRQVHTTPEQKRRRRVFDILLCWGLPCLTMALHYVVQGHRFDIVEDVGCIPAIYVSVAAICLLYVPILMVILLTLIFASMALYHFFRRRITFARHLQDAASAMTPSRYFRLMAMALVQMLWSTGVTVATMVLTFRGGLRPWISWQNVHSDFGRVGQFPRFLLPSSTWASVLFSFWIVPASSVLFFVFFAFGQDAVKEYRAVFVGARRILRLPVPEEKKQRITSIPTFVARFPSSPDPKAEPKRGSKTSSFTNATDIDMKTELGYENDIPLTPQTDATFDTVVDAYVSRHSHISTAASAPFPSAPLRRDSSFYMPPPPHFPTDVGDLA